MTPTTLKPSDTKAVAAYFRGNPKFGRTTKLVVRATGEVLCEGMGVATRAGLWRMLATTK